MNDSLAVHGFVATKPRHLVTNEGLPITSFRLVTTRRRYNRQTSTWESADTNWYTVSAFRQLARNIVGCVSKGDPVIVSGRLSVREWEGERSGVTVEIEADSVGHDLVWGSSAFVRTVERPTAPAQHGDDAAEGGATVRDAPDAARHDDRTAQPDSETGDTAVEAA